MHGVALTNILARNRRPTPGEAVSDSNLFPGHENRMADHTRRIWHHTCERTDGKKCRDCLYRRKRK